VRADQLAADYDVRIEWWPFELHPETPPEGRVRTSRRPSPLTEIAAANGLTLRSPDVIANSRPALEATEFARDLGEEAFDRLHRAIFRAYFEDGRNIGELDTLLEVAAGTGIDRDALATALTERRYRDVVDERMQWALSNGIASTPTFVFQEHLAIAGAQEYRLFERVMERMGVPKRAG
jgi:predicted DsbA family dithiol-disulfide isomerase